MKEKEIASNYKEGIKVKAYTYLDMEKNPVIKEKGCPNMRSGYLLRRDERRNGKTFSPVPIQCTVQNI